MIKASQGSAAVRKEAFMPAPSPHLSHAIRAIQLMLRSDCNGGEDDFGGLCARASHHEGRAVVAAYKASR